MGRRDKRDRGASLVEYALLVALVAGLSIGAVEQLGDRTEQRYQTTAADLTASGGSSPDPTTPSSTTTSTVAPTTTSTSVVPSTTSTTLAPTTTTTVAPTTTTTLQPPVISAACTGASCSLSITNRPVGSTVTWVVVGTPDASPTSGSGPSFGFTGGKKGSYDITATLLPGGAQLTQKITCTNANAPTCSSAP